VAATLVALPTTGESCLHERQAKRGDEGLETGEVEVGRWLVHASYTAALDEDPTFAPAWANRAALLYTAGRTTESAEDLDRAITLADDPVLRANACTT